MSSTEINVNNLTPDQLEVFRKYTDGLLTAEEIKNLVENASEEGDIKFYAALANLETEKTLREDKNFEAYKENKSGYFNSRKY